MLISTVWEILGANGVEVTVLDPDHVLLRSGSDDVELRVHASTYVLSSSDIGTLARTFPDEVGLLIVPAASRAARERVAEIGWSVISMDEASGAVVGEVRFGPDHTVQIGGSATAGRTPRSRGRIGWGALTVVRRLLAGPVTTQAELARVSGVSQPRVSQSSRSLVADGLIEHAAGGWRTRDWDGLLDWWLERYPGPGGLRTYWYGLDPPAGQGDSAIRALAVLGDADEPSAVLSGDLAADRLAPWRRPQRAIVYSRRGPDLSPLGLTPAGAGEATLELIVPKDPGVWPASTAEFPGLADPVQVYWDVLRSPGPDADDAAGRLRAWLRERHGSGARARSEAT